MFLGPSYPRKVLFLSGDVFTAYLVQDAEREAIRKQVWEAWQASLPMLSPKLEGDKLLQLMYVRLNRTLIITGNHVVYCKARHVKLGVTNYKLIWLVRREEITTIVSTRMPPDHRTL